MLSKLKNDLAAAFARVVALVVSALLLTYFLSMALGPFLLYWLPQGLEVTLETTGVLPLSLFMVVNFAIPLHVSVGLFFLALWLLYVGAFMFAWYDRPRFHVSLKRLSLRAFDLTDSNYLALMPQIASVVLVLVVAAQALQESAGVQTGGISFENPVLGFLSVAYAPFVEELSYRISTIGVLDGLYLALKRPQASPDRKRPSAAHVLLLTLWKPESAKELLGVGTIRNSGVRRGISRFEWLALVATSLMFGAAHYLSGGGWEIGKISTAFLSGFAMGFAYLRYGAYAPILLHWFFNYYFGTFDLAWQLNLSGFDFLAFGIQFLNLGVGTVLSAALIIMSLARVLSVKHRGA